MRRLPGTITKERVVSTDEPREPNELRDFIRDIVAKDLASGKHDHIVTRFPPEPNGYLHIGHAKAICLGFGVAAENGGVCHLRFDDTNPAKERGGVRRGPSEDATSTWLGFDWEDRLFYASDYFEQPAISYAVQLIEKGKAYVCDLERGRDRGEYRGTVTEPGRQREPGARPLASRRTSICSRA